MAWRNTSFPRCRRQSLARGCLGSVAHADRPYACGSVIMDMHDLEAGRGAPIKSRQLGPAELLPRCCEEADGPPPSCTPALLRRWHQ